MSVVALCRRLSHSARGSLAALTGDAAAQQARAVLVDIRAPRVALALLVGGGFGATGAAMQALFRNPLADPLVGVSSGARSARRR